MAVAEVCPNVNSEGYKKIEAKVGRYSALRLWTKLFNAGVNPDEIESKMEQLFTVDRAEKRRRIEAADGGIEKQKDPKDPEKDVYVSLATGNKYARVSEKLNEFPQTVYRHAPGENTYAETGTNFHEIFRMTGEKYAPESIALELDKLGIPKKLQGQAQNFFKRLIEQGGGEILVEKKVFSDKANLAGQVDLIHLKADGTIDLYDFKTTYITEGKRKSGTDPWNPVKFDNGYKANRYTAQLEAYGRILEDLVGHPPSNYFIVPIVVDLAENNKVRDFEIRQAENVMKDYGFAFGSKDIMDRVFNHTDVSGASGLKLNTNDTSGQFISRITGMFNDYNLSARKIAETVKRTPTGYFNGYRDIPWAKQGMSEEEKIDQIIREYVNNRLASGRSFAQAIKDFIESKDDKTRSSFFNAYGKSADGLKRIFSQYVGRKNIEVIDLATIAGFQHKKGWIAVKDDSNYDLYYITEDNLKSLVRTPNSHQGLFAEWFSESAHASYLQTDLKNVYGDAKVLEAVLIAMKMKESFGYASFGNIALYSLYDRGGSYEKNISLGRYLPTIKALWNSPKTQGEMPKDMQSVFGNPRSFDPSYYAQDYVKLYSRMVIEGVIEANRYIKSDVDAYLRDANNKKQLSDSLARQIIANVEVGKSQDVDPETRMLAEMYFQINKIHRDSTGISWWENWASAPQNHSDPVLQAIYLKTNQAVSRIQQSFWYDYKEEFKKIYDSLVSDSGGIVNSPRDYTLGDTARYFTPLYETRTVDQINADGTISRKDIYTFKFKPEGSPEFKALTTAQQNAITKINDLMQKIADESGMEWQRGNLPLIRADFYNSLYNARKEKGLEGYKRALSNIFQDVTDIFASTPDRKNAELSNVFLYQSKEGQRNGMLGLTDENQLLSKGSSGMSYGDFSTNLEVMLDAYMIQGLKYNAFKDLAATIKAASVINSWKKSALLDDTLGTVTEHLANTFTITINNRDPDSNNRASKPVRAIQKGISFAALGWKVSTAAINYLGQEFSMSSQAVANAISKTGGYSPTTMAKAHAIVWGALGTSKTKIDTETYEKISQLMIRFRLHNQDLSSFMNGFHRYSDKTLFKSKMAYSMMTGLDWVARAEMMVAQMIQDGTWDAYPMRKNSDGEWELGVYDESKDQRWKTMDSKKATALKKAIMEQQREDGVGDGSKLFDAYDSRYLTKMKAEANNIGGATNREDRNNANFTIWGRFFTFFKSWIPVKLDRYISKPYTSEVMGNMEFEENENGETVAIWKGEQMEGIFFTWLYTLRNLNGLIKGDIPLTSYQKNNLVRSVGDTVLATTLYMVAQALLAGDDDDEWTEYSAKILMGAWGDLAFIYEMMKLDEFYYTPVSLTYLKSRIQAVQNIMAGLGDEDKDTLDQLSNNLPYAKQFDEISIITGLNEE